MSRELDFHEAVVAGEVSEVSADRAPVWRSPTAPALFQFISTRLGLTLVLVLLFGLNLMENAIETRVKGGAGVGTALGHQISEALHGLEGYFVFQGHDATNAFAIYGYSVSYFFLFPLLGVSVAVALALRREIAPFRVFSLSVVGVYAISLPFFLFFPVIERWAHPDSGATLLSDKWTSTLIETIRPISGLDNSFPSFHVSLTVAIIVLAYLFRVRMRNAILPLGATVVLSTYFLGIHWIADILAGVGVGVLGVWLAVRIERRLRLAVLKR